jgi:membrane-associated protease RseP (regulator of RpoE activity)
MPDVRPGFMSPEDIVMTGIKSKSVLAMSVAALSALGMLGGAVWAQSPTAPPAPRAQPAPPVEMVSSGAVLGVEIRDLDDELRKQRGIKSAHGVVVGQVVPGSAAQRAGLQPEDVITAVDGKPVDQAWDVITQLSTKKAGDRVAVTVERKGVPVTLSATIAAGDLRQHSIVRRRDMGPRVFTVPPRGAHDFGVQMFDDEDLRARLEAAEQRVRELEQRLERLEKKVK